MNAVIISALLFMFMSSLFARNIIEKAMAKLDQDKKVLMIDLFRSDRMVNVAAIAGLVFTFFCLIYFKVFPESVSIYLFLGLVVIYLFLTTRRTQLKLIRHDFPQDFIRSITISSVIRFLGFLVLSMTVVLQQNT